MERLTIPDEPIEGGVGEKYFKKTWFLTEPEAESKMAEMEGKK